MEVIIIFLLLPGRKCNCFLISVFACLLRARESLSSGWWFSKLITSNYLSEDLRLFQNCISRPFLTYSRNNWKTTTEPLLNRQIWVSAGSQWEMLCFPPQDKPMFPFLLSVYDKAIYFIVNWGTSSDVTLTDLFPRWLNRLMIPVHEISHFCTFLLVIGIIWIFY